MQRGRRPSNGDLVLLDGKTGETIAATGNATELGHFHGDRALLDEPRELVDLGEGFGHTIDVPRSALDVIGMRLAGLLSDRIVLDGFEDVGVIETYDLENGRVLARRREPPGGLSIVAADDKGIVGQSADKIAELDVDTLETRWEQSGNLVSVLGSTTVLVTTGGYPLTYYSAIDRRSGKLLSEEWRLHRERSDDTGALALAGEVIFAGVQPEGKQSFSIEARDARSGKVLYAIEPELAPSWNDDKLIALERRLMLIHGLGTEKTCISVFEE